MNESYLTHKRLISHIWITHVSHTRVTHRWVMSHTRRTRVSHLNESCLTYEWVMSDTQITHVSYLDESCVTHTSDAQMTHVAHKRDSRLTCEWVKFVTCISTNYTLPHTATHAHVCEWVMSWEVGGWGRVPFSRNLMKPTPRRKWYLTTGRRFH